MNIRVDSSALQKWLKSAAVKLAAQTETALQRTAWEAAKFARVSGLYKDRTYKLFKSIRPTVQPTKSAVKATAPYAFYVENGTRPHAIVARRRKALRFVQNGEVFFRRSVWHPGTWPRPFMAEAQKKATPLFSRLVAEAATKAFK